MGLPVWRSPTTPGRDDRAPPGCCSKLETLLAGLDVAHARSLVLEGREVASHQILPRTVLATGSGGREIERRELNGRSIRRPPGLRQEAGDSRNRSPVYDIRSDIGADGDRRSVAHRPRDHEPQLVAAILNGHRLGLAVLGSEWTDASFAAPRHVWNYGFNLLELRFRYASQAADTVAPRQLSAAIDAIKVDD